MRRFLVGERSDSLEVTRFLADWATNQTRDGRNDNDTDVALVFVQSISGRGSLLRWGHAHHAIQLLT